MRPLIKLLSKRTAIRIASIVLFFWIATAMSKLAIGMNNIIVVGVWIFINAIQLFIADYYIDKYYKTLDEQMYDLWINSYTELFENYWDQYDFDIRIWKSITISSKIEWGMCILLAMNDSSYLLDQSDEFKINLINFITNNYVNK